MCVFDLTLGLCCLRQPASLFSTSSDTITLPAFLFILFLGFFGAVCGSWCDVRSHGTATSLFNNPASFSVLPTRHCHSTGTLTWLDYGPLRTRLMTPCSKELLEIHHSYWNHYKHLTGVNDYNVYPVFTLISFVEELLKTRNLDFPPTLFFHFPN